MNGTTLSERNPVVQANEVLAGRVRTLESLNEGLRRQLSNQADTIVRQAAQLREARSTTVIAPSESSFPQGPIESYRATIDQQRNRINELRDERDALRRKGEDTQRELEHAEELLREHRRTIVHLQESVTTLVGEVRGGRNECDRLRQLAVCRLHHIESLEDALENNRSIMSTKHLLKLEEAICELDGAVEVLADLLHNELNERTLDAAHRVG